MRNWGSWIAVVVVGVIVGLLMWVGIAPGADLISAVSRLSPSVAALYQMDASGNLRFTCTTTVVDVSEQRTRLLTAGHCVGKDVSYMVTFDGAQFYAAHVTRAPKDVVIPKYERGFGEPEVDLAFFDIRQSVQVPTVPMATVYVPQAGQTIITVGYPLGVSKIAYNGIISGVFSRPGAGQDGYLLLQIFGAPGSSGSAVVDQESGEIIGVLVSGKQGFAGLPVIFATPIWYRDQLADVQRPSDVKAPKAFPDAPPDGP